jgi:lipopolysaccharide export system permease protein
MTRIDRYVLRQFLIGLASAFVFFLGLYLVIHFFNRLGRVSEIARNFREAGWDPVLGFFRYYGVGIPFIAAEFLPFSVLAASMWCGQTLSKHNEITAALVAGVSTQRLGLPMLAAGLAMGAGFAAVQETVLPELAPLRHEVEQIARGRGDQTLRGLDLLRDGRGRLVSIQRYDVATDTAHQVLIREPGNPLAPGLEFDSIRWRARGDRGEWFATVRGADGGETEVVVPIDLEPQDVRIATRALAHLPAEELRRILERSSERTEVRVLLHAHYVYPFRALVLLLVGLPLVLWPRRGSPTMAVGMSFILSIAFFAVQNVAAELGRRAELLPPDLAAWFPIFLFGTCGVVAYSKMRS